MMDQVPTLEQSTQKIAAYIADAIPKTGDFLIEQAPDVVQQMIRLDLYRPVFLGSLLLVIGAVMLIAVYRRVHRFVFGLSASDRHNWDGFQYFLLGAAFLICTLPVILSIRQFYTAIGPAFAPKAHLLERIGVLK